jgi:hypothetical protein
LKNRNKPILALLPLASCATATLVAGCAGPSTPLGGIWAVHPNQVDRTLASVPDAPTETSGVEGVKIDFKPTRQVLHGPKPLIVRVQDPNGIPENPRFKIRYDGYDVTTTFMEQARRLPMSGEREIFVRIPVVRLSPHTEHKIQVLYYNAAGKPSWAYFQPPVCRAFDFKPVRHTDSFNPDNTLLNSIEALSEKAEINPALMTALIAQESSFNPRTVSWAKAIGLTQMTPIAEDEVSDQIPDFDKWPHYKKIERLPASVVKMMVLSGRINDKNDWKLDRELSIRGGLAYLRFLQKLWSTPAMMARFDEVERTKLVLASYNSGRVRVLMALHKYGKNWMQAPELREARLYVNRIFSFCDFFSQDQMQDPTDQMTQMGIPGEYNEEFGDEDKT